MLNLIYTTLVQPLLGSPSLILLRESFLNAYLRTDRMSVSLPGNPTLSITQAAVDVFLQSQKDDGLIGGISYWQTANGYTAIALHDTWSNTTSHSGILDDLIAKVEVNHTDLINGFNDDTMWWSMCSLELFDLDDEPGHLETAQTIWKHVNSYVIPKGKYIINGIDMKGGVIWSNNTNETQVNAITTGLYSELSARLAVQTPDESEKEKLISAATDSLSWIERALFDEDNYVVFDQIDLATHQFYNWTFTYNTGQAIAASIAIYGAMQTENINQTQAQAYLDLACNMASHAMGRSGWVDKKGTLTESGAYGPDNHRADKNDDAIGFKAVLLRSLAKLYKVLLKENSRPDLQTQLVNFIKLQFQSLQGNDTNGKGQYGPWWDGPMDTPTSWSQMAALDVMAAIHAVGG